MLTTVVSIAAVMASFLGIPTLFILVKQSIRESREARDKPIREALASMTQERDYFRDRADAFETELRKRGNS